LLKLPREVRDMIWGYSVAVRPPVPFIPDCEVHYPKLQEKLQPVDRSKLHSKLYSSNLFGSKASGKFWQCGIADRPPPCTCPNALPPRFYPCGAWSVDFGYMEEAASYGGLWKLNDSFIVKYPKSKRVGILQACKQTRIEALESFYSVNQFFFPGSHDRYHDRQVMQWLLAPQRRQYLEKFHHIEWYAPTDELAIRSYAVIIVLVELGVLVGTVVRRGRHLIDLYPARHDDLSKPIGVQAPPTMDRVMPTTHEVIVDDKHILCGLRMAVRERIELKRITKDAVLHGEIEELEDMMSAVASRWWRECSGVWSQGPCSVCSNKNQTVVGAPVLTGKSGWESLYFDRNRTVMGEPVLIGTPAREKDDVPGKSQTSVEAEGLPIL
jgi:hypothetical protein